MTRTRPSVPWALLLPVATTALFVLWWTNREERTSGPPFTPQVENHGSVEGWGAALDLGAGRGRLSVRLWPLHSEPEVQAFDAAALARRLELAAGEPWIAELSWTRPVDAGPERSASSEQGAERELLEAGQLAVRDGRGQALAPLLSTDATFAEDGPADPLRVLLAPPLEGLGPEQSLSVLLWGRGPVNSEPEGGSVVEGESGAEGAPRLAGLRWSDGEALGALELEPVTHALDGLPRDLARLSADGREDAQHSGVR